MITMNRNPYFDSVPDIGNLYLEETFVEDVCPIFFTCVSNSNQRYIVMCCELYEEQRWIIAPISNESLLELLTNKLSIRNVFTKNKEDCIIAHWSKENPVLRYEKVAYNNKLLEHDLPLDEMLEVEDDEFTEYVITIQDFEQTNESKLSEILNILLPICAAAVIFGISILIYQFCTILTN